MAQVKEVPGSSTRDETALDQPWNVVVHNDPVNLMVYVTMVFRKVFGFSREKAEFQQLHSHLLLATIERAGS